MEVSQRYSLNVVERLSKKIETGLEAGPYERLGGAQHATDRCSAPPTRGPQTPSDHFSDNL